MIASIRKMLVGPEDPVQKGSGSYAPKASSKSLLDVTAPSDASYFPQTPLDPVTVPEDCDDVSDSSDGDDFVDTPETPGNKGDTHGSFSPATPLTPPMESPVKMDPPSPCVARKNRVQTASDAGANSSVAVRTGTNGTTKGRTDSSAKDEINRYRAGEKLLRNLTDDMKACMCSPLDE